CRWPREERCQYHAVTLVMLIRNGASELPPSPHSTESLMHSRFRAWLGRPLLAAAALALTTAGAGARPQAQIRHFQEDTARVIDTTAGAAVATIPVAAGPHGIVLTGDGRWVYVANDGSSQLTVIDTATDRVARTIEVGKAPNGLALTPDGKLLLAAVFGEDHIAFIDPATQTIVGTAAVPKPHTIAVRPDGKVAYVTSQAPG